MRLLHKLHKRKRYFDGTAYIELPTLALGFIIR